MLLEILLLSVLWLVVRTFVKFFVLVGGWDFVVVVGVRWGVVLKSGQKRRGGAGFLEG